jgi:hypothetical protein
MTQPHLAGVRGRLAPALLLEELVKFTNLRGAGAEPRLRSDARSTPCHSLPPSLTCGTRGTCGTGGWASANSDTSSTRMTRDTWWYVVMGGVEW